MHFIFIFSRKLPFFLEGSYDGVCLQCSQTHMKLSPLWCSTAFLLDIQLLICLFEELSLLIVLLLLHLSSSHSPSFRWPHTWLTHDLLLLHLALQTSLPCSGNSAFLQPNATLFSCEVWKAAMVIWIKSWTCSKSSPLSTQLMVTSEICSAKYGEYSSLHTGKMPVSLACCYCRFRYSCCRDAPWSIPVLAVLDTCRICDCVSFTHSFGNRMAFEISSAFFVGSRTQEVEEILIFGGCGTGPKSPGCWGLIFSGPVLGLHVSVSSLPTLGVSYLSRVCRRNHGREAFHFLICIYSVPILSTFNLMINKK